jgi:hypothetical protein
MDNVTKMDQTGKCGDGTNLLEDVVLFGHHDQLEIGSTFLYHLHHLGVGFAHDRLAIDTHHLVTCRGRNK